MKKIIFLTVLILFTLIGCNKQQAEDVNLQWSEKAPNEMSWDEAKQYCENLDEGGHNDWRLPNIDELRTVIKNCSKTETGGECKVSEKNKCLYDKCWNSCHCELKENNGGYYSKLGDDDKVWLWSSSVRLDYPYFVWIVGFHYGTVANDPKKDVKYNVEPKHHVRCVRNPYNSNSKGSSTKSAAHTDKIESDSTSKSENTKNEDLGEEQTNAQPKESTNKQGIKKIGNLQWSEKAPKSMTQNDAVNYCKNLNEGGYTDWRLPNIDELRTLIQNHPGTQIGGSCKISEKAGKLAKSYWSQDCTGRDGCNFSKLGDFGYFLSSSVLPRNSDFAYSWFVNFSNGHVLNNDNWLITGNQINVRCVRGEIAKADLLTTAQPKEPTKNQGITKIGNLQWSAKSSKMNWYYAVNYCKNLHQGGHNDWRLPNIDELRTLIQNHPGTQSGGLCPISEKAGKLSFEDRTNDCNAREASNFSKLCDSDWLWSSSTSSGYRSSAWYVHFFTGLVYIIDKTDDDGHVRCVR